MINIAYKTTVIITGFCISLYHEQGSALTPTNAELIRVGQ